LAIRQRAALAPKPLGRGDLTSANTFEFWSRKLGRQVLVIGPSQFDAALILEFDPGVAAYCERPAIQVDLLPAGEGRFRAVDFWVERRTGRQAGLVVFEPTKAVSDDLLRRSMQAAGLRWDVWLTADLAKRDQFIRNLKQLRPYVSSDDPDDENARTQIAAFLKQYTEGRWAQVLAATQGVSGSDFARTAARMYHAGQLELELDSLPLSSRTWVKAK